MEASWYRQIQDYQIKFLLQSVTLVRACLDVSMYQLDSLFGTVTITEFFLTENSQLRQICIIMVANKVQFPCLPVTPGISLAHCLAYSLRMIPNCNCKSFVFPALPKFFSCYEQFRV